MLLTLLLLMPILLVYTLGATVFLHFQLRQMGVAMDLSRVANVIYLYQVCRTLTPRNKVMERLALSVLICAVVLTLFAGFLLFFSAPAS